MFKSKFDELFNRIITEESLILEEKLKQISHEDTKEILSYIKGIQEDSQKSINMQLKELGRYIKSHNLKRDYRFSYTDWQQIWDQLNSFKNSKIRSRTLRVMRMNMHCTGKKLYFQQDEQHVEDNKQKSNNEEESSLSKSDFKEFKSTFQGGFGKALVKAAQHGGIKKNKQEKFEHALLGSVQNKTISPDLANSFNTIAISDNLVKDKDQFKQLLKKYNVNVSQPESKKQEKIESHFEDAITKIVQKVKEKSKSNKDNKKSEEHGDDSQYDENLNGLSLEKAYKRIKQLQQENNWKKNKKELNALGVDLDDVDEYQDRYKELSMKINKYHKGKHNSQNTKESENQKSQHSSNEIQTLTTDSDF